MANFASVISSFEKQSTADERTYVDEGYEGVREDGV